MAEAISETRRIRPTDLREARYPPVRVAGHGREHESGSHAARNRRYGPWGPPSPLAQLPAASGVMTEPADPPDSGPIRVVIADDVPDMRLLVRIALTRGGDFDVVGEAGDGREAVDTVERLQPDVVLLDLSMPVLDGLQAIPELRARSPRTKIVVLSGFNAGQMADEVLQQGAHAYLTKGVRPPELLAAVRLACGRQPDQPSSSREPATSLQPPAAASPPTPPDGENGRRGTAPRQHAIEELAAANSELAAANERKDRILLEARHELRNPAVVMAGFASMLVEEWDAIDETEKREIAGRIERQSQRLGSLVDELLLQPDEVQPPVLEALDVEAAVLEAIGHSGLPHPDIGVSASPGLRATADRERLNRILINLLTNAFRHGAPPVMVEATRRERWIQLRVSDCGEGVPPDLVPHLFEGFGEARRSRLRSSSGLGLSIVRDLSRSLGGDVWYEPGDPKGSCFVVRLPLATAPTPGPAPGQTPAPPSRSNGVDPRN